MGVAADGRGSRPPLEVGNLIEPNFICTCPQKLTLIKAELSFLVNSATKLVWYNGWNVIE